MPSFSSTRRCAAALITGACLLFGAAGGSAKQPATAGILPPKNPPADCDRAPPHADFDLIELNRCRAKEGVGPMRLPSNWNSLSPSQQQFVIIDIERVNRGLAPIVGLSAALSALAARGASAERDPAFPANGFSGGGGLWAASSSLLGADYEWMYDDGLHGYDANLDCRARGGTGCWLHRDIILWDPHAGPLVAGAGYVRKSHYGSYAFEILSGHSTAGLTFSWAHELRYFAVKSQVEPSG